MDKNGETDNNVFIQLNASNNSSTVENDVEMEEFENEFETERNENNSSDSDGDDNDLETEMISETLLINMNNCIEILGASPINSIDRKSIKSKKAKFEEIMDTFRMILLKVLDLELEKNNVINILVDEIKEKLSQTDKSSEKVKFLTMVPKNWTTQELESRFSVSHHMALKAKKLHDELGIGSSPNPKPGKKLNCETEKLIKEFYYNDEYSRCQPG